MSIPTFSASVSNEKFENLQLLGKDFPDKLEDLQGQSLPIVFAGLGKQADFTGKDVNGKIAPLQRGKLRLMKN